MSRFCFKEKKATQLAAMLIERNGGSINYVKLIKLMYLADRSALLGWERPITGDSYMSMNKGPILSNTLNIIREHQSLEGTWAEYISKPEQYQLTLNKKCPIEALSEAEEEVVEQIFKQYGHLNRFELINLVHELPEWEDPGYGNASPLSVRRIFEGEGMPEQDIDDIEQEVESLNTIKELLGCK